MKSTEWMKRAEGSIVRAWPETAGRICWDTLQTLYRQGFDPYEAAERYVEQRVEPVNNED